MTPVELLHAAIDKLERLKADTAYQITADGWLIEYVSVGTELVPRFEPAPLTSDELIVTLHRTIDAQLAILRAAVVWFEKAAVEWSSETWIKHPELAGAVQSVLQQELALADAILGGEL